MWSGSIFQKLPLAGCDASHASVAISEKYFPTTFCSFF